MKFEISESTRLLIKQTTDYWYSQEIVPEEVRTQIAAFKLILALTEKYHALVMNPPYMQWNKMNNVLSEYARSFYESSKLDLCTIFMVVSNQRLLKNGKYGMINMQSWMFLSSYESFRLYVLNNNIIDNLLHLGPHTFDELSGEIVQNAAFVFTNSCATSSAYFVRLVDGENCTAKKSLFIEHKASSYCVNPNDFKNISGNIFGYWLSDQLKNIFKTGNPLSSVATSCVGLQTSDNDKYIMQWNEVDFRKIGFNCSNAHECATSMKTWFPYNKGGESKWYGGNRIVVKWFNNGEEIKLLHGSTVRNEAYYFLKGITFPRIGSSIFKARVAVKGSIFDINGPTCYSDDLSYTLGLLNSNVMSNLLRILCPTITFQIGDIFKVPYLKATKDKHDVVVILSDRCIELCKEDWDAHETSWDFLHNELLSIDTSTYMENIDYKMKKHFEETGEHINLSLYLLELICSCVTDRTLCWCLLSLIDITAYCTYKLCHNLILLFSFK